MKNFYILIFTLLVSTSIFAQDFSGVKICVDPGHGGHDAANDRFIPETGFWESDGNFSKALYLKDILEDYGAEVILTRTSNTDASDISLSARSAIANSNNVDYFHSIHSNALNGQVNYPLILFRGYDDGPVYPASKEMGIIMFKKLLETNRGKWNYAWDNVRGDWDFYPWGTSGLGVLRNLTMPGTLSEGSFHDYLAESFRLRNEAYRHHESWAIARSFAKFFDTGEFGTGTVAGILRNPEKSFEYYAIPGTNDDKKPIDNIKVTLLPDSIVYHGDEHNNGFYMFDSLVPGEYKLIFEAQDFYKDSATVTVSANKSSFADKFLTYDESIPPEVLSHEPDLTPADSVLANSSVKIVFSRYMDPATVETAFSISPEVEGVFKWENENQAVIFTPIVTYEKATEYEVTISTEAKSKFGVSIIEPYAFSFVTKNRNRVNLVKNYPENGGENLSTKLQVELQFDNSLVRTTIGENVLFLDPDGIEVESNFRYFTEDNIGFINISPDEELTRNTEYTIFIKSGLLDSDGLPFNDSTKIVFKTTAEKYVSGNILDDFESVEGWTAKGEFSTGTDSLNTTFNRTYSKQISGQYSGRLAYIFTEEEGGIAQFKNENGIPVDGSGTFGLWVFGDLSGNVLEFYFYDSENSNFSVVADTLDFSGWKLVQIPSEKINISGEKTFHSLVVKQTVEGSWKGILYVDDLQTDIVVPVGENKNIAALPQDYELDQNYPNPFNPSTTIKFALPEAQKVKLEIFNLLGQRVTTLVNNEDYQAGIFTKVWNGKDNFGNTVPSGIYLYRLEAGDFVKINKMVMLK